MDQCYIILLRPAHPERDNVFEMLPVSPEFAATIPKEFLLYEPSEPLEFIMVDTDELV